MISIIIPAYNEEKYLPKLLESIKKQTFHDYEVIVADANSKDHTRDVALQYGCSVVKGGRPAFGRNTAAKVAKGEYLLFLDSDVILPKNFLQKTLHEFKRKKLDMAITAIRPISNIEIDKLIYKTHNDIIAHASKIYPLTPGSSIFITKKLHDKLHGFDETMHISEDNDYGKRAKKIANYGAITDTYVKLSMRRLNKEGRIKLVKKYFDNSIFEQLEKIGIKKKIEYNFGDFKEQESLSELETKLENALKFLNKIFKK